MNKLKLILTFVLVSVFSVGAFAQTLQDVNTKFNEAGAAMNDKKYEEAIKSFEEVITMGDAVGEGAISTVDKAKAYLPALYVALGKQNAAAKNFEKAVEVLEKGQEVAGKYNDLTNKANAAATLSQVYMYMGSEAYNSKDYAKAVEVFAKGYEASPNNSQLALYLADSYDQLGNFDEAAAIYKNIMGLTHSRHAEAVVKAKEEYGKSLIAKAAEASKANNYAKVVEYSDEILEFDPANGSAVLLPLQTANNAKNYNEVIKRASTIDAITDAGLKSDAYFLLGMAYQNTEDTDKAIETYRKVTAGNYSSQAKSAIAELSK